ncbi:MAG: cyclic nucleotide-binding domain-containing protein [Methylacidiphilales bacterium]|nr:cyclic nucleotide-binding domain-containing protein [Candidatus Methylacidiphilales bacterium]
MAKNSSDDIPADFFSLLSSLDEPKRQDIEAACTKISFQPRQSVYEQGSAANTVYIVASGLVEAITFSPDGKQSRLVALMSRGDFFGDLAVFTDHPRLATVRTCEASEVLSIEKKAFLGLMRKIPDLGLFFSRILANRLYRTSSEAHHKVYSIDLTGNLQRFDLLTIVQAITGMGHTGELHLHNSANELLGDFFFRKGRVEHARFGHLFGLEAIWQGFIESASEGTFTFRSTEQPSKPFPDDNKIDLESTNLLLEGVGKRDTFQGMPETLRLMEGRLARIAESLDWQNDETRAAAEQIWKLIPEPQPLVDIWRKLNYSAITFLETVMEMGMNGHAELFVDESKLKT